MNLILCLMYWLLLICFRTNTLEQIYKTGILLVQFHDLMGSVDENYDHACLIPLQKHLQFFQIPLGQIARLLHDQIFS